MGYFSRKRGLAEIQGRLQEDAAVRKIGGDVGNINDLTVENFRTYDLISSEGVFSVKSHLSSNGELTDWAKSAYQANFDSLLGWGREVDAVERDAKAFFDKIPSGTPSPKEIAQANLQQATEFLKNKSVLCIPEDHVQGMREYLRDQAIKFPETYNLPKNPTEEQLNALTDRIQGTGLTGAETALQAQEIYQRQEEEFQQDSSQENESLISDSAIVDKGRDKDLDDDYHYGFGL